MISVGAIDNDRMLLEGMTAWMAGLDDIRVALTACSVEEFLAVDERPALVLLDLNLEDFTDPVENVRALVDAGHVVIVLSVLPRPGYIAATTEAGAATYVVKSNDLASLAEVIRMVDGGEQPLTIEHAFWLGRDSRPRRPELSAREREVLVAYGSGMTADAVARKLGIATHTVKTHLDRIKGKYRQVGRPIEHRGHYAERIQEERFGTERLP